MRFEGNQNFIKAEVIYRREMMSMSEDWAKSIFYIFQLQSKYSKSKLPTSLDFQWVRQNENQYQYNAVNVFPSVGALTGSCQGLGRRKKKRNTLWRKGQFRYTTADLIIYFSIPFQNVFNPFTPIVIFCPVCLTIFAILVWRIWYQINY